jgi:anti-anti-sigma factor
MPFAVRVVWQSDAVTVRIAGDLDLATAGDLALVLQRDCPGCTDIALDLRRVTFLDCAGLRVLLYARERAQREGGSVRLTRVPSRVRRVLRLAGLDDSLRPLDQREYSASNSAA